MGDIISKYFPESTKDQVEKLLALEVIYRKWNSMINVISRKDIDNFMVHHVLHSLAIARVFRFAPGSSILDVGTGGGFPGIPLAIAFPETWFTLLDSIGKKIRVVTAVAEEMKLKNVTASNKRAEDEKGVYDFVVSRAVTDFPAFARLTKKNVKPLIKASRSGGIICLKGGDLEEEIGSYRDSVTIFDISDFFTESFFETKRIVHLPL